MPRSATIGFLRRPWGIGLKIGAVVSALVVAVLAIHMLVNDPRELIRQQKYLEATRLGRIVVSIVAKEMVEVEPWRVQEHLTLAARPDDVDNIRIIDQTGTVRYGVREEEIGRYIPRETHEQCRQCHLADAPPQETLWTNAGGEKIFSLHYPLRNQPACQRCHEADSELLGKVLLDLRITKPDLDALSMRSRLATSGAILVVLTILGLLFIVRSLVAKPIHRLMAATQEIEAGNFDVSFPAASQDEIGELTLAFERMAGRLGSLVREQEQTIEERTAALRQSQQQMIHQEKMAAMGRLTAGVAHEIGNPLASISAMVQLLERTAQEEKTQERAHEIDVHVQRISRIVRELVEFYRPGSVSAEWVDVSQVVQTALGIAKYDRDMKAIDVQVRLDSDLPRARLVEDHLLQVILNLVFNAVDAMPEGGTLTIEGERRSNGLELRVVDTGEGFTDEDAGKLFDPFFTSKPVGKGTGLGLWMSYSLVKRWDGTIQLTGQPGEGATARIWIPRCEPIA